MSGIDRSSSDSLPAHRLTVDQYERIVAAGLLDDLRVELIDGYMVQSEAKTPPHVWTVDVIVEALRATVPGYWCRQEDPVRIPDLDEPEPDASVVRGTRDDYRRRIPGPDDVVLAAEVAESTLDLDRGAKRRSYAHAGIPFYWIINLVARQVEVYSSPSQGEYLSVQILKPGDQIPVLIAGVEVGRIDVASVLP